MLFTTFFSLSDSFYLLSTIITTPITKTIKIASDIPLSLAIILFSSIAGSFSVYSIDFMSRDDKFIIPSIVVAINVTLAGSYTFACKLINRIIWSIL